MDTANRHTEAAIDDFRGRLYLLLAARYGLAALTLWAFAYGTAVLALRGTLRLSEMDALWGLLSLPAAVVPALFLASRRMPTRDAVRAVIDRHARCGGLLMAEAEHGLGGWSRELPELHLPALHWRSGKSCGLFAAGLAFVAVAFLVPQGFARPEGGALDVKQDVERLSKQIDVLEKEKFVEAQRAIDLKEKLEQVRRDAKGNDPTRTLQSLDAVKDAASKVAEKAAEDTARKMADLARGEMMTKALEKNGAKLDDGQLKEAMEKLDALTKRAAKEKELLEAGVPQDLLDALKNGDKLTKEQMQKLEEALKNLKQDAEGKIEKLVQARLLDAKELEKLEEAGKMDAAELAKFLKENGLADAIADALKGEDEDGGNGGTDEGGGSPKIKFDHETDEAGAKFKEEMLPPSALEALKDSTLAGVSVGTPKVSKEKMKLGGSGALGGAKAGGGSAGTQVILPRHRGAVERFFDRKDAKAPGR